MNPKAIAGERGLYRSSTPFKVFRYAEVLLNRAEALYELGLLKGDESLKAEAFVYINQVRERAGARPYTMVSAPVDVGRRLARYTRSMRTCSLFVTSGQENSHLRIIVSLTYVDGVYCIRRWRTSTLGG